MSCSVAVGKFTIQVTFVIIPIVFILSVVLVCFSKISNAKNPGLGGAKNPGQGDAKNHLTGLFAISVFF